MFIRVFILSILITFSTSFNLLFFLQQKLKTLLIEVNDAKDQISRKLYTFFDTNTNITPEKNKTTIKCVNALFKKSFNTYNYWNLLFYSGKELSDLGLESECFNYNFSYYLLTYDYKNEEETNETNSQDIRKFLGQKRFYTGLCFYNECNDFLEFLFDKKYDIKFFEYLSNNTPLENITLIPIYNYNQTINTSNKINCTYDSESCRSRPYYTLNKEGKFDAKLTEIERNKYLLFFIFFIIFIGIIVLESILSIGIYCCYAPYMNTQILNHDDNEDDYDDDDDDDDEIGGGQLFGNAFGEERKIADAEINLKKFMNSALKYFSFFTNVVLLTIKKSKFYNNKNIGTINLLRIFCLLLITFSVNFEVLIKIPAKCFFIADFYKEKYFILLKYASFGLDMFICLDGFEVMFKLMSFYKKKFYDKGKKVISFLGIIKFYFCSLYKIAGFFILFFLTNYFSRYYIQIHDSGALYNYYTNNLYNKEGIFQIFNPKYNLFPYNIKLSEEEENFFSSMKISNLFINEFYIFTLFIIIFFIGNRLKSKIYDFFILLLVIISYFITQIIYNNFGDIYSYYDVAGDILITKYPHIIFNRYMLGVFTGLICFYFKDALTNNSITNEITNCPFRFCFNVLQIFEHFIQKWRIFWILLCIIIQLIICATFTLIIEKKNNFLLNFDFVERFISSYEGGLFTLLFCFMIILIYSQENDPKSTGNFNVLNLIDKISFSYVNTSYLMMYSYYCTFRFQLELTYQNLWLITCGLFIFLCVENLILTIMFILPFKIVFKMLLDCIFVLNKSEKIVLDGIKDIGRINNSRASNEDDDDGLAYQQNE